MAEQSVRELPKGWVEKPLGQLVVVERGSSPRPIKNFITNDEDGVNWVKIGDAKKGKMYIDSTKEKITKEGAKKSRFVDVGDFILSNSMSFGLPYIMAIPGYIHDGWFVIRLPKDIDSSYFYYLLSSSYLKSQFHLLAAGGVVKNISGDLVKKALLPIAPLAEQKRIVEKLDSLLGQVETIQQRLEHLPDIIKRFRQSVLAAAVSGKLTEEWRKGKTLAPSNKVFLEEILQSRKDKWEEEQLRNFKRKGKFPKNNNWKKKYKNPIEGYLDEYDTTIIKDIPKEWLVSNLDLISIIVTGKTPSTTDEENWNGELPFISPSQISPEGLILNPSRLVSDIGSTKVPTLPINSILIVCIGTIGKVGLLDKEAAFNQQINALIPVKGMDSRFLFYWSKTLHTWLNKTSSAVVNAAIINKSRLSMAPCPIPSLKEQAEIVRLVEKHFALADTLETHLQHAKQRIDNLTQSILAKAFRGELVPQDPNDEPADKLLERIKTARAEAQALEKAAKKAAKAKK